jgi:hypothetical protein
MVAVHGFVVTAVRSSERLQDADWRQAMQCGVEALIRRRV